MRQLDLPRRTSLWQRLPPLPSLASSPWPTSVPLPRRHPAMPYKRRPIAESLLCMDILERLGRCEQVLFVLGFPRNEGDGRESGRIDVAVVGEGRVDLLVAFLGREGRLMGTVVG